MHPRCTGFPGKDGLRPSPRRIRPWVLLGAALPGFFLTVPQASATLVYRYEYVGNRFDAAHVTAPYTTDHRVTVEMLTQFPLQGADFELQHLFLRITMSDGLQTKIFDHFVPGSNVRPSVLLYSVGPGGIPAAWDIHVWEPRNDGLASVINTVDRTAVASGGTPADYVTATMADVVPLAAVYDSPGTWSVTSYEDPSYPYLIPEPASLLLLLLGLGAGRGIAARPRRA